MQTSGHWDRTDYYYNESWQCLEERKSLNQTDTSAVAATVYAQYLWDIRYIDAPVCRWRSTQVNGTLDENLYYCNDANMNVTALVDTSGSVVERYAYDPYGKVTVLNPDWSPRDGNVSAYDNQILYCGYRYDPETGLYNPRIRIYHPTIGRWGQGDPSDYAAGANLYLYGGSLLLVGTDPMGRDMLQTGTPVVQPAVTPVMGNRYPGRFFQPTIEKHEFRTGFGRGIVGSYELTVGFGLPPGIDGDGFIIQSIHTEQYIKMCNASGVGSDRMMTYAPEMFTQYVMDNNHKTYYETWSVEAANGKGRAKVEPLIPRTADNDSWFFQGTEDCTWGVIEITGEVKGVLDKRLPPTFQKAGFTGPGNLLATRIKPDGWDAWPGVKRKLVVSWNACGGGEKRTKVEEIEP